jgi:hypothetical protein
MARSKAANALSTGLKNLRANLRVEIGDSLPLTGSQNRLELSRVLSAMACSPENIRGD